MSLLGTRSNQGPVATEVLLRHSPCGKSFLEMGSHLASIEFGKPSDRFNSFRLSRHDKACYTFVDDLRHRAGLEGNDRRAAGHGLDHDEAEWFRPIDRKQQR